MVLAKILKRQNCVQKQMGREPFAHNFTPRPFRTPAKRTQAVEDKRFDFMTSWYLWEPIWTNEEGVAWLRQRRFQTWTIRSSKVPNL